MCIYMCVYECMLVFMYDIPFALDSAAEGWPSTLLSPPLDRLQKITAGIPHQHTYIHTLEKRRIARTASVNWTFNSPIQKKHAPIHYTGRLTWPERVHEVIVREDGHGVRGLALWNLVRGLLQPHQLLVRE